MCETRGPYKTNLWEGGEWVEVRVTTDILPILEQLEGIFVMSDTWAHCCGDDVGEELPGDCDATEDFDPITCRCVSKGSVVPISSGGGQYVSGFRPNCAVSVRVMPDKVVAGQPLTLLIYVSNRGLTSAPSVDITVNWGDGNVYSYGFENLSPGDMRPLVVQHIYGLSAVGAHNIEVRVACPGDALLSDNTAQASVEVAPVLG